MKKILVVILASSLLAISAACLRQGRQEARKVLVVIWDGAEWIISKPYIPADYCPPWQVVGPLHHLTTNTDCFGSGEACSVCKPKKKRSMQPC